MKVLNFQTTVEVCDWIREIFPVEVKRLYTMPSSLKQHHYPLIGPKMIQYALIEQSQL